MTSKAVSTHLEYFEVVYILIKAITKLDCQLPRALQITNSLIIGELLVLLCLGITVLAVVAEKCRRPFLAFDIDPRSIDKDDYLGCPQNGEVPSPVHKS